MAIFYNNHVILMIIHSTLDLSELLKHSVQVVSLKLMLLIYQRLSNKNLPLITIYITSTAILTDTKMGSVRLLQGQ